LQTKNIAKIEKLLKANPYPGRGIIIGKSGNDKLCLAYFLSGRSQNSRNRILEEINGDIFTRAFDESKIEDPSLIIYPAIKRFENNIIVISLSFPLRELLFTTFSVVPISISCYNKGIEI